MFQAKNHMEKTPRNEKTQVQPKSQTLRTCKRMLHRTNEGSPENLDGVKLRVETGKA